MTVESAQAAVARLYAMQEELTLKPAPPEYEQFDLYDRYDEELFDAVVTRFEGVEPPLPYLGEVL